MDEIIERYNRAVDLYSEVWERRVVGYNDQVAQAIVASWKDVQALIRMLQKE